MGFEKSIGQRRCHLCNGVISPEEFCYRKGLGYSSYSFTFNAHAFHFRIQKCSECNWLKTCEVYEKFDLLRDKIIMCIKNPELLALI